MAAINTTGDGQRNRNDLARNVSIAMQCLRIMAHGCDVHERLDHLPEVCLARLVFRCGLSKEKKNCENGRLRNS